MKLVFTHENKIIVENAKALLQEQGIEAIIKNEFASSGLGELSAIDTWPEVWILNNSQLTAATTLIEGLLAPSKGEIWQCKHCDEQNEPTFEICWNCQH
ncbi:putative signal transducing protein [Teredinibacter purpureus]|uniref:putative signal transducing protein n=1 Tax=Teredinibacter purpureus TaxID=2731756 RepID=UPI0005F7E1BA|nr:DUF2007 domain-containing protein [Teredinibacter purpureus]